MDLPQEALEEYLSEGDEIIQRVSSNLSLIEKSNYNKETINCVYRDMHTLKGSSLLFGFNNIGEIGHVLESCLDPVRRLDCPISADFVGHVYTCLDLIEKYMESIRETGQEHNAFAEEKNLVISKLIEISTNQYGQSVGGVNDALIFESIDSEINEAKGHRDPAGEQSVSDHKSESENGNNDLASSSDSKAQSDLAQELEPQSELQSDLEPDLQIKAQASVQDSAQGAVQDTTQAANTGENSNADSTTAESIKQAATESKISADSPQASQSSNQVTEPSTPAPAKNLMTATNNASVSEVSGLSVVQAKSELGLDKAIATASSKEQATRQPTEIPKSTPKVELAAARPSAQKAIAKEEKYSMKDAPADHQAKSPADVPHGIAKDSTIRVSVDLLDKMMNLVGELVLVRNQVLQFSRKYEDMEFSNLSQSMDIVTTDLQGEIMKTRMQPIGNVLSKYTRIVRDTAIDLDKNIRLDLIGNETELDKTLLEAIRDPLTHIIRNSCDHGIESKEVRQKNNKPDEAVITIKSMHEGGQVSIEVSDDGGGIDKQKVLDKAVEKGVISREKSKLLSDKEIFALILTPGFSTAEKVTSVSGRGVGMDVVKTNIEKIGGNIEINSVEGVGTQMRLKIPLTLAIVPAMLVRISQQIYCIPQFRLVELVRVEPNDGGASSIEMLQGKPVFRLRGELLALVSLSEILGIKNDEDNKETSIDWSSGIYNIVVLNSEGSYFGLMVDEILDTADIVVKPISQFLKTIRFFSGATIMGDGSVSLILDVVGISDRINMGEKGQGCESAIEMRDSQVKVSGDVQEFLTFSVGQDNKYAMPLCLVHRLEKFKRAEIESSGDQRVTQYRGSILPIVDLKEKLGFSSGSSVSKVRGQVKSTEESSSKGHGLDAFEDDGMVTVIVTQKAGMYFGVQVDDIEDVVTIDDEINEDVTDRRGILGNIVHDDQMTVIVDILSVLDGVVKGFSRDQVFAASVVQENITGATAAVPVPVQPNAMAQAQQVGKGKILLVEDTPFFRKKLTSVLSKAGYEVISANNGQEAYELLQGRPENEFQLILSDIEMPHMDGYELAEHIRNDLNFKAVPLIAITTRFRDRDVKRGKSVGFDIYMEKLNEVELLNNMNQLLQKGA